MNETPFFQKLQSLPDGAYDVLYRKRRYLFRKSTRLNGKLIKLYGHELGGNDFISGNYYVSLDEGTLKPCEMPYEKVVAFVVEMEMM